MLNDVLPEFQKFLLERKIVPEKSVSFYAYWVSRFLSFFSDNDDLELNLQIEKFLDTLRAQGNVADWQVQQAEESLRLYFDSFPEGSKLKANLGNAVAGSDKDVFEVLDKTRQAIRIKHYSYRTERSYLEWINRFFVYLREVKNKNIKVPELTSDEVRDFLSYLAVKRRVSSSTQNQAFNALLFLFNNVLNIKLTDLDKAVRAKRGPKLPVVLTEDEVKSLFDNVSNGNLLILQLLYGAGLRLMELARLRVQDIDFNSDLIFVRSGKQDKDRSTLLPAFVKDDLKRHLEKVKALHDNDLTAGHGEVYMPFALERKYPNASREWRWQYVFPAAKLSLDPRSGKVRRHHISEKSIQNTVKNTVKKAGIAKHVTVHTLRHSFATHLLLNGTNIRQVQELLGHNHLETTMIYTHVVRDMSNAPSSPLDRLYNKVGSRQ
ncbi:MAG: integron integrase [Candidatus Omnitrophica bacterium]|nr:integron integrase [Candidatus Omnitrophota bacterium]